MSQFIVKCKLWMMTVGVACLIHLLWCVVEIHSQTKSPYLTFMGETIPNNSYVDLRQVGQGGTPAVITCVTLTCPHVAQTQVFMEDGFFLMELLCQMVV